MTESVKSRIERARIVFNPDKVYNEQGYFFKDKEQLDDLITQAIKEHNEKTTQQEEL